MPARVKKRRCFATLNSGWVKNTQRHHLMTYWASNIKTPIHRTIFPFPNEGSTLQSSFQRLEDYINSITDTFAYFQVSMGAQLKPYKEKEKDNVAGEEGSLTAVLEEGEEENEETPETGYTWRVSKHVKLTRG